MRALTITFLVIMSVVVVVGCGAGSTSQGSARSTLIFGTAGDPITLDGALVQDGESLRPVAQIFETLIRLKAGTPELEPSLARSWSSSHGGQMYTFELQRGVKFQDGTPFDSQAVCANFERWYHLPAPLQNPAVSYYWNTRMGGFAHPAPGAAQTPSLYKRCIVHDKDTVSIELTRPSGSFLYDMTLYGFAMASPTALKRYHADQGSVSASGQLTQPGTFGTDHPVGTGPFKLASWQRGDKLTLVRNDDYWGPKAKLSRIIFRPIADNAARLQALQNGEIEGYDLVEPQDVPTLRSDSNVRLLKRAPLNVGYVGISQRFRPLNNLLVRQALAYGLDREQVVKTFYAGAGEFADQYMPPTVPGYSKDVPSYPYNPERSKQLLRQAGLKLPVAVDFWYPTGVSRPYMPDPKRNFEAFAASLDKAGFAVNPRPAQWGADYVNATLNGKAALYLLGWVGDYADGSSFLGAKFSKQPAVDGSNDPALGDLLRRAEVAVDPARRAQLYSEASRMVMEHLPVIPYVWTVGNVAVRADVKGFVPSVAAVDRFDTVSIG